ncbi:MAG: cytochrome b/b6 domain-containing protein [Pseudomonadota bacterium]
MKRTLVWDLPTRLFHWSLVVLIIVSFYTGYTGGFREMDIHMLSGYGILALVVFRILWGIVGSRNARFASFVRGPGAIVGYLRGTGDASPGHNPLGALSVIAILVALLVQVTTGLFANDDIMLEGPLTHLISYDTSRQLTAIHEINRWVIVALVVLHLLAITFYQFVRKAGIIGPMVTGYRNVDDRYADEKNNWVLALVLLGVSAGLVYCLVNFV